MQHLANSILVTISNHVSFVIGKPSSNAQQPYSHVDTSITYYKYSNQVTQLVQQTKGNLFNIKQKQEISKESLPVIDD